MGDNCQTGEWGLELVEDLLVIIKFTACAAWTDCFSLKSVWVFVVTSEDSVLTQFSKSRLTTNREENRIVQHLLAAIHLPEKLCGYGRSCQTIKCFS